MVERTYRAVILAAGKGTRMKSKKAKVLHEVFCRPMLHWVLDAVQSAGISSSIVIVGHQKEAVLNSLTGFPVRPVFQEQQLGTGHAVLCAEQACDDADAVMILCGDTPLITSATLQAMMQQHEARKALLTLMTTTIENPTGYGRILRRKEDSIQAIVEQKDASDEQRNIKEINAGIYIVQREFLFSALKKVGTENSQGEVYLTDIVAIGREHGLCPQAFHHPQAIDVLGVNSRVELAVAHSELQKRRNIELMLAGISMYQPESITVSPEAVLEADTVLYPGVQIFGKSRICSGTVIESGAHLHDCQLGEAATVGAHSVLYQCIIAAGSTIAPLSRHHGDCLC